MKKNGQIRRVSDQEAEVIKKEGWDFVPKSEFKKSKKESEE